MGFGVVQNLNREKVSLKVFRSFTVSYSVHASCPPSSSITPKTSAKFSSLNSSIARARRHRRERKAPRAILELSDAKFAEVFGVILMFQNQGFFFTPEFTVRALKPVHSSQFTKKYIYIIIK